MESLKVVIFLVLFWGCLCSFKDIGTASLSLNSVIIVNTVIKASLFISIIDAVEKKGQQFRTCIIAQKENGENALILH